jgi:hypothetical protein
MQMSPADAARIALDLKKALVDKGRLDLSQVRATHVGPPLLSAVRARVIARRTLSLFCLRSWRTTATATRTARATAWSTGTHSSASVLRVQNVPTDPHAQVQPAARSAPRVHHGQRLLREVDCGCAAGRAAQPATRGAEQRRAAYAAHVRCSTTRRVCSRRARCVRTVVVTTSP